MLASVLPLQDLPVLLELPLNHVALALSVMECDSELLRDLRRRLTGPNLSVDVSGE